MVAFVVFLAGFIFELVSFLSSQLAICKFVAVDFDGLLDFLNVKKVFNLWSAFGCTRRPNWLFYCKVFEYW